VAQATDSVRSQMQKTKSGQTKPGSAAQQGRSTPKPNTSNMTKTAEKGQSKQFMGLKPSEKKTVGPSRSQ